MNVTVSDGGYAGFKVLQLVMNDTVNDGYFVGFKLLVMNVSDSDRGYARFNLGFTS